MQVLCRRTKNNPVLIGEAGVGKTAIVEGLAQKIVTNDVPEPLMGKKVISLDLGAMRGRHPLPRRVRGAAQGLHRGGAAQRRRDHPLHRRAAHRGRRGQCRRRAWMPATCSSRRWRAANCSASAPPRWTNIASTSRRTRPWSAALRRSMWMSPTSTTASRFCAGCATATKNITRCIYDDEALVQAVKLSHRYVTDRRLPDKAIDLMDEAAAKLRVAMYSMPPGSRR